MNIIPFRVVSFDDTATFAMGEAFDVRANRSGILALPCLRLSRISSLQPPRMASAIRLASMTKY
jgi:hypothetical protein